MVRAYRRPKTTAHEDIAHYEANISRLQLDQRASNAARDSLSRVPPDLHDRVTWGIGFDEFGLDSKQMMYIDVRNFNNRVQPGKEAYVSWGTVTSSIHGMGTILAVQVDDKRYPLSRQNALILVDFDGVQAWVRGYQITAIVR